MVTITNSGEIEVKGKLIYTWEGVTVPDNSQPIITIQPGDTQIWTQTLPTESGAHTAEFNAQWVPISGSYDANPANSQASGSVEVVAQLRLVWSKATMSLVHSDSTSATSPLTGGEEYTVSINLASQGAGTGSVNYSCQNGDGEKFATIQVNIIEAEEVVNIECTFTATAPFTNINLIPSDSLVSSTQSWNWDTNEAAGNIAEEAGNMTFFTAGMIALICLILIVVLIAAVILTREVEEEVERDIFDYCPACDGELVGGEDRCPHCSFNLKKQEDNSTIVLHVENPFRTYSRIVLIVVLNKTYLFTLKEEKEKSRKEKQSLYSKRMRKSILRQSMPLATRALKKLSKNLDMTQMT